MKKTGIPDAVKKFIIENISSAGQLEVLLFLYRNKNRKFTEESIGSEMRSSEIAASQQLSELLSLHLVLKQVEFGIAHYTFDTVSIEQQEAIRQLEEYYNDYRVSIITLIYEKPVDALRSFANAFKIKRDK